MTRPLDAGTVRRWCRLSLDALGRAREDIDAINVYPVADGDTGTNLYLTMESAARAVEAAGAGDPDVAETLRAMAHGSLIGARGNSGTILAQLLRGMAVELGSVAGAAGAGDLGRALRTAADSAYRAVAHPVEGTMLTVAAAAARAAEATVAAGGGVAETVTAACEGAREALAGTPERLPVLARAGVVDAGGSGLLTVLEALDAAVSGGAPAPGRAGHRAGEHPPARLPGRTPVAGAGPAGERPAACAPADTGPGPAFEVIYLLDADDADVPALRERLDRMGDSLVVVGGDGLWHLHLHTDEPGAAVEAGIRVGRPHRIRIAHLPSAPSANPGTTPPGEGAGDPAPPRAVVAVLPGDGLAELCREAGAVPLTAAADEPPSVGELAGALRAAGAPEVVLLPNDTALWHPAAAAAQEARRAGVRVSVIPTRSPVQGLAALAVHAPERRFDEDVVAMTAAAGATRFGELGTAETESWTSAGVCRAGDVLGLIDGDVVVFGDDPLRIAAEVLDRMLSGGGELVTLVTGAEVPRGLADRLEDHLRSRHPGVDTVRYEGRQGSPLLIGVE
ncbi:DAK2 domain-containing protein [Streptomyces calidiresistens]|uniref:DAK2 domain-containing protein n=1 Tax=Streptomyces calidiresistens TaxID=1485586 RepID=A0A7W3T5U9_9ACTN|nr:DAK2 domain-containing protein [Streptomyces calidiresistens]MBB0231507.1 DAK2 domain-containing protein [Streptomyces calidiresistens]